MDMISRAMGFVIVTIAAQVQQVQLVNQAMFFEQVDGAIDSDQVHALINFLGTLQDLVHIQMLLGVIHNLQNDAPLPRQANSLRAQRLLQAASGFCGVESFTGRNPVLWGCGHAAVSEGACRAS
jgi:hypothetical protein